MNAFLFGCVSGVVGFLAYLAVALISQDFGVAILAGVTGKDEGGMIEIGPNLAHVFESFATAAFVIAMCFCLFR